MKTTIRMLLLDIMFKLHLIKPRKYANQKCQLSYLIVNEAMNIQRSALLNKE